MKQQNASVTKLSVVRLDASGPLHLVSYECKEKNQNFTFITVNNDH